MVCWRLGELLVLNLGKNIFSKDYGLICKLCINQVYGYKSEFMEQLPFSEIGAVSKDSVLLIFGYISQCCQLLHMVKCYFFSSINVTSRYFGQ